MAMAHKQQSSALARCKQLVERARFDLQLAMDAARSADVPFSRLVRLKRARREMDDLLRELTPTSDLREQTG
jgi:hypothetical protein